MNHSKLDTYSQPYGGLFSSSVKLPNNLGEPYYPIYSCSIGNLKHISFLKNNNFGRDMNMTGAGGDINDKIAKFKSQTEALERYSNCIFNDEQFINSSYNEIEEYALDLNRIPCVSNYELEMGSYLDKPDNNKKIRWVKGYSLTNKKEIWVPACMVYLYIPQTRNENFWLPISTGSAIHQNYENAIISGINEVVERDSISLTWLHKLQLKQIVYSNTDKLTYKYEKNTCNSDIIETKFFDATTDLGIPTIYCLQKARFNNKVNNLVLCSTELNPKEAYRKLFREAASLRIALQNNTIIETNPENFIDVMDGALYMGRIEKNSEFDFLYNSKRGITNLDDIPNIEQDSTKKSLKFLLETLKQKGHEVIVVDLTCDEVERQHLKSVKVIIPSLMPLSFSYKSRFLGTKRLYEYPFKYDYKENLYEKINNNPQPFA
ncbi:YcaO-like family protein [Macrococcus equi]|uniref:YcaO-like family protein n=1 Tax=Macrococcus equi TaxID=3395462 RepID=UPI0039BE465C